MTKDDNNNRQMSLRDIAREAGVSVSTVSRVLSGSNTTAKISEKTRKRILDICEAMKFHPNIHYRRLHEGRSRVIALLIPPPSKNMMFFDENVGSFLSALEPRLARHGFHIMLQSTTRDFFSERRHVELLRSQAVDAVIFWDTFANSEPLLEMVAEKKPLIQAAFPSEILEDQVIPDNFQGSYDLARHLIQQGHQHIVHVVGAHSQVDADREAGYHRAMEEASLKPITVEGQFHYQSGFEIADQVLRKYKKVTAIMAANDMSAAGCVRRLKELGRRVPEDIAVTGFDGTSHSEVSDPRITTANLQLDEIGKHCADRVVKAVTNPQAYKPRRTKVPMPIIMRESTVPPKPPSRAKKKV